VIGFSLVIFYYAVSLAMESGKIQAAVETEERQLAEAPALNLPG
jgi:hypothetical protein